MMNSKALRSIPWRTSFRNEEPKTPFEKVKKYVAGLYLEYIHWPVTGFFRNHYRRLSRALDYAKYGYDNYDYDSHYIYDLLSFKMDRIYKTLEKDCAIQEEEDMEALKEAIKLCNRLFAEEYDEKYHKVHDEKWGKLECETIPEYDDNGKIKHYRWESHRANAVTDEQKEAERAERRIIYENEEKDRLADLDRLNEIFKKHIQKWWS